MADEEEDMGPWSSMPPDLVRAVSQYGTPPYRESVRVPIREVGNYSFDELPRTIDDWIKWLELARAEVPTQYQQALHCVLSWEDGSYDDYGSASFDVWYDRPETDDEMIERVGRGIRYVQGETEKERQQYERLRAKFGPKRKSRPQPEG